MIGWVVVAIGVALFLVGVVFAIRYSNVGGADVKLGIVEIKAANAAGGILLFGLAVIGLGV